MMRALFSIVGLLVVLFVVMQLGRTQLKALQPAAAPGAAAGTATDAARANPGEIAREQAARISGAIEQGAAQRASEASR